MTQAYAAADERFAPPFSVFDAHAHYDDRSFDGVRDELIPWMFKNGVGYIVNNATDLYDSAEKCLEISEKYDFCYTAVGIHPETVETGGATLDERRLRELAGSEKVVAVGEIGLDYHYSTDRRELQKQVFLRQCELANELSLPVVVHDRDAHNDTLDILRKTRPRGVVHCFSGSAEMAAELIKLGLYIGIGGVVTFHNARKLAEVAERIPLTSILLETDAPYLAPVPHRGKQCNSAYIYYTAARVAEIRGITTDEVLESARNNAFNLFKKAKKRGDPVNEGDIL